MENEFQALADSLGAAGKVDDQGSFADHGHAAAEHGAVSDLGAYGYIPRYRGRCGRRLPW